MTTGDNSTSTATRAPNTVLVVGATSSLAQALCRMLAARGFQLVLTGRDPVELRMQTADLQTRYSVSCGAIAADFLSPEFSAEALLAAVGEFSHLIIASGEMGSGNIADTADIAYTAHLNYTVPAQIAAAAAKQLEGGNGSIVIISSVAGDRGRAKIAAYGSAKAALSAFASALRQAYAKRGVHVLTVKPGFTDTPMTWGMQTPLMASREAVAKKILRAMEKKKNTIYAPFFWRFIMLAIVHIPERVFKRLAF